jgi:hydrogenase maturation protein HypF
MEWDDRLASVAELSEMERATLRTQLDRKINTPLTSSMGRLFDAAAALASVRQKVNYEAQAAIEFEALADKAETKGYSFGLNQDQVEVRGVIESLIADALTDVPAPIISARFHNGFAEMVRVATVMLRNKTKINEIALSGGVWQNITLLGRTLTLLEKEGFRVYIHREVPTNDGGLSLGQAAIAVARMRA